MNWDQHWQRWYLRYHQTPIPGGLHTLQLKLNTSFLYVTRNAPRRYLISLNNELHFHSFPNSQQILIFNV